VFHQQFDFTALKFLSKRGHSTLAMPNDRYQTSRARDVKMLAPPLAIGKIGRLVSVTERSISAPINTMTTRAISPEQIDD